MGAVLLATVVLGLHPERALRDPAAYMDFPFYIGVFSNLGVLGWWSAAATALLAAALLRADPAARSVLFWGGILSAALAIDDLFLLHEEALPRFAGLPEDALVALHALATLAYLWRFRAVHASIAPGLLGAALVLFALSVGVDLIDLFEGPDGTSVLLEDGAKFAGICAWATYHAVLAHQLVARRMMGGGA
jgi:hypothetical protein